jgi:hypothetical protein
MSLLREQLIISSLADNLSHDDDGDTPVYRMEDTG